MNNYTQMAQAREDWERRTDERLDRLERRLANERFETPTDPLMTEFYKAHSAITKSWFGAEPSPMDNHLRNDKHNQP